MRGYPMRPFKTPCCTLCMIALLILFLPAHGQASHFSKEWNRCITTIRTGYYAIDAKKTFIDNLIDKYAPAAGQARTHEEFQKAVNAMLKEIGDSHFQLMIDQDLGFHLLNSAMRGNRGSKIPFIGAFFRNTPQGWTTDRVLTDGSAAKAGLREGDLIITVNGIPFSPFQSMKKLKGKAAFEILRGDRKMRLEMEVRHTDPTQDIFESIQKSIHIIEQDGKKIGYIKLWSMLDPRILQLMTATVAVTFMDTDAVIVDLRDCMGGMGDGYPDIFFLPAVALEQNDVNKKSKKMCGYAKPVVVLINKKTASAAEGFSYMMKANKRATLIGNRTAGAYLVGGIARISSWAMLLFPVTDLVLDNNRLEGKGVEPDITVTMEYDPNGEDLVLNEALKTLTE
jgi:carboxyl-terminal processing protease